MENYLSWNVSNLVTVCLMVAVGFMAISALGVGFSAVMGKL